MSEPKKLDDSRVLPVERRLGPPSLVIEKARQLVLEYKDRKYIDHQVEIWHPDRLASSNEVVTVAGFSIQFEDVSRAWVFFVNLCPPDSIDRSCVYVLINSEGEHIRSIDSRTRPSGRSGIQFVRDEEFWNQQGGVSSG